MPSDVKPIQMSVAASHGIARESRALSRSERAQLLELGAQNLQQRTADLVGDALEAMGDALADMAGQSDDPDRARDAQAAAILVRDSRAAVQDHFAREFKALFEHRLKGHTGPVPRSAAQRHELALVDDAFMRDKLRVEKLVQRTRAQLDSEEVLGMRARLGVLADRDWFDEALFPAAPGTLYESLQLAIDQVDGDAGAKWALLAMFEPYVSANLNIAYAQVNAQWRSAGVLPAIKPRVAITPDNGRRAATHGADAVAAPDAMSKTAGDRVGASDRAGAAPADREIAPVPAGETFVLPARGPEREAILAALARDVAAGGLHARQSAMKVLTEPQNFAVADLPVPQPELIRTLDSMQSGQHEGELSHHALVELTARTRENGSPLDQLTVEIVALIFEFLHDDPRIPDAVKQELGRLQIVAIKAALLDRSFFASRQHPMRRLIDRTSDIACDPQIDAAPGSPFAAAMTSIVGGVLAQFDRDLAVFERAVEQVEALEAVEVARHAARVTALADAGARRERTADLLDEALRELEARIDEMTPEFTRVFLIDCWAGMMVSVRLRDEATEHEGADGIAPDTAPARANWARHLQLAEHLLWSVAPRRSGDVKRLATILPGMIKGIADALKSQPVPVQAKEFDEFMQELMRWHTRSIANAKREEQMVSRAPRPIAGQLPRKSVLVFDANSGVRFAGTVPGRVEVPGEQQPGDDWIAGLSRGKRFELQLRDQPVIACKLAWISPARQLFALARFPDFARSYDRAALIGLMQRGELVAVDAQPILDRAIGAIAAGDPASEPPLGESLSQAAGLSLASVV